MLITHIAAWMLSCNHTFVAIFQVTDFQRGSVLYSQLFCVLLIIYIFFVKGSKFIVLSNSGFLKMI